MGSGQYRIDSYYRQSRLESQARIQLYCQLSYCTRDLVPCSQPDPEQALDQLIYFHSGSISRIGKFQPEKGELRPWFSWPCQFPDRTASLCPVHHDPESPSLLLYRSTVTRAYMSTVYSILADSKTASVLLLTYLLSCQIKSRKSQIYQSGHVERMFVNISYRN
jgi:hypothetical protein